MSPVFVFRSLALASVLALTACGGSDEQDASNANEDAATAVTTTTVTDVAIEDSSPVEGDESPDEASPDTTTGDIVTTAVDDSPADGPAEPTNGDLDRLCTAYLESITFSTAEEGLATLAEILGPDAPVGVQDALDTLLNPNGDIEGFFSAQNSLEGYILPICREQFAEAITPRASDEAAANAFVGAVRDGDLPVAESLAPTNVIVSFDWNGFPDTTWDFSTDNSTVTMTLEPTVTVFCQIAEGAVEACAFGE